MAVATKKKSPNRKKKATSKKVMKSQRELTPCTIKEKDYVSAEFPRGTMIGTVSRFDESSGSVIVNFPGGEKDVILKLRDITKIDAYDGICPSLAINDGQPGFNQYPIQWIGPDHKVLMFGKPHRNPPEDALSFTTRAEGVEFYGHFRKTKFRGENQLAYVIDIYARYEKTPYTLPTMIYNFDPRLKAHHEELDEEGAIIDVKYAGMRDLNGDICAHMNRWLHFHLGGNVETLTDLRTKAENPRLQVKTFEGLYNLITQLVELYEKSEASGGYRSAALYGEGDDPMVLIQCDLTGDILAHDYKIESPPTIPELLDGKPAQQPEKAGYDSSVKTKPKRGRRSQGPPTPSGSLDDLTKQLEDLKAIPASKRTENDKRLMRKIRQACRTLRKK